MLHLPSAELQFANAAGLPYAGGSLEMMLFGTSTRKDTWSDIDLTVLNPNPIPLDTAGRCIVWGEGAYRSILRDAGGAIIWDKPTFTYVSDAMEPVVAAATIAEARTLLGIDDSGIAAEAAARAAADAAEMAARIAADQHLQDEIDAEIAARIAADDAIRASRTAAGNLRMGAGPQQLTTPGVPIDIWLVSSAVPFGPDGYNRVTFDPPFTTSVTAFVVSATGQHAAVPFTFVVGRPDVSGCDVYAGVDHLTGTPGNPFFGISPLGPGSSSYFYWMAVGH